MRKTPDSGAHEPRPLASPAGLHVAIIMDGNGRWANARGWPRLAGHREGARSVRRVVEASPDLGIGTLTLYAFSADNWQRPAAEVAGLMRLLRETIRREVAECRDEGVRISFVGRRDRIPGVVVRAIEEAERDTQGGARLHLRIAVDYSAREAIARAAARLVGGSGAARGAATGVAATTPNGDAAPAPNGASLTGDPHADAQAIDAALLEIDGPGAAPAVDLLVRTAGEQRLSDFLLWESAYAELYFTQVLWPEFGEPQLAEAVRAFHARERRFGGLVPKRAAS